MSSSRTDNAPRKLSSVNITCPKFAFSHVIDLDDVGVVEPRHGLVLAHGPLRRELPATAGTQKETVRADLRRKVKRLLRKHGYPPDKREAAVLTVIEQAERVAKDWAMAA